MTAAALPQQPHCKALIDRVVPSLTAGSPAVAGGIWTLHADAVAVWCRHFQELP